jgi:hypothetical protein
VNCRGAGVAGPSSWAGGASSGVCLAAAPRRWRARSSACTPSTRPHLRDVGNRPELPPGLGHELSPPCVSIYLTHSLQPERLLDVLLLLLFKELRELDVEPNGEITSVLALDHALSLYDFLVARLDDLGAAHVQRPPI